MAAKARPKAKKPAQGPGSTRVTGWEEDQICIWLALTGNVTETAKRTGRTPGACQGVLNRNTDKIILLRVELRSRISDEVVATVISEMQLKRQLDLDVLGMPTASERLEAYSLLGTCLDSHGGYTEQMLVQMQILIGQTAQPARDAPVTEETVASDVDYLKGIVAKALEEAAKE